MCQLVYLLKGNLVINYYPSRYVKGTALEQIRVAFLGLPKLLVEILKLEVFTDAEIEYVGSFKSSDAESFLNSESYDVLLLEKVQPARISLRMKNLLLLNPELHIIALSDDGKSGYDWRLTFQCQPVGEIHSNNIAQYVKKLFHKRN